MASIVLRAQKAIKGIVILTGQPIFKLIVLGVKPLCKSGTDFINLGIGHLYGFHIPYFDFLIINCNALCYIRCCIYQGMF
ncbi:hypothetical protein D3C85_1364690 [compost metagenome]